LNFFLWGSGYIYNGTRTIFGIGLIIVEILEHAPLFIFGLNQRLSLPLILYPLSHLLTSLLLAYDAYIEVKPIRDRKRLGA
jgi:hypothetical protein